MQIIVRQLIFTIANKFSNPLTLLGTLLNFWSKASDMLWAGSVEMISTVSRTRANCTERLQLLLKIRILKNLFQMFRSKKKNHYLQVVLPTPPLPPTKIHRKDVCSITFFSVGSSWTNSSSTLEAIMYANYQNLK